MDEPPKKKKKQNNLPQMPEYGHEKDNRTPCFCRVCLSYWYQWVQLHPSCIDIYEFHDSPEKQIQMFEQDRLQYHKEALKRMYEMTEPEVITIEQRSRKRRSSKRTRRRSSRRRR